MSGNNQDYDNQNDESQNYDDQNNQDQEEYDSQDDNSQNDNENGDGGNDGNDDGDQDNDNDGNEDDDDEEDENGPKYIRLRGLPWSATHKEILDFLKNVNVIGGAEGIHIITRRWDFKNTGEAYVEVEGADDVAAAMKLDNASMGHRYIEVFNASSREAKEALRKTSRNGTSYVVKLRGLPYSVTEQQVEEFFNGLEIKADREGIIFVMDRRGRATGEAFVQFESQEDTEQALGRNRQKIGHRYIEIFRSSLAELKRSTGNSNGRMAPYDLKDRGSNRGSGSDYGGNSRNGRGWGNNGGFGIGANNTLGFNNLPNFGNNGNFGNNNNGGNFGNFGNNGGGNSGGMGNYGNFGNNGGGNFGNFGNNGGNFGNNSGGGGGNNGGFNRFSGNSGNFGNDFGDFGNFGNNRGMGSGNSNDGFSNFGNFGNGGGGNNMSNNMGGGFGNNMSNMGGNSGGGGNFGPIGGGRSDDYFMIMMRGLPFTSFENDVFKFFEPLRPANVRIHYNKQNGRHNGTAEAMFETYEESQQAMKRHRSKMGARYIELFFNGKTKNNKTGNNYSSGGSMGGGNSIGVGGGMSGGMGGGMGGGGMGGGGMGGNAFSRRI